MQITTIGLDIAKNVFQVNGIDAAENVTLVGGLHHQYAGDADRPILSLFQCGVGPTLLK